MKRIFRKETIIGSCVIIALAVLFFGIEYLKGVSVFRPANYFYAVYTDSKGLATSAPVTVNGFKIGTVDNVGLMYDRPGKIIVCFSIDKQFKLPTGSKAVIDTDMLGTASVKLECTDATTCYSPGDTIPGSLATGLMDAVGNTLMPALDSMVPKIDSLLTNINAVAGNPALQRTIGNLEATTASLSRLTQSLNASASRLPGILDEAASVMTSVDSISADLNHITTTLAQAPIDSTLSNVQDVTARLADVTRGLTDPDTNIGKLLNGTELYDNVTGATASLDSLLRDIKRNPKRYISIKLL